LIRPFQLRDIYLLQKLARQSTPLHLERHLTQPRWPLGMALSAPIPWYGSGAATFVNRPSHDHTRPEGFVQARKRLGRSEADVCHIAPKLSQNANASETWQALLAQLIAHAGDFGIQRLYACLPSHEAAAEIVAASGFSLYVRETLFRLEPSKRIVTKSAPAPHVRPQRESDSFALQRLSDRYTPPVVQKAEGSFVKEEAAFNQYLIFQNWWQPGRMEGLVFEKNGALLGAMRIRSGRKGHWLHFLGDATHRDVMQQLLTQSLHYLQKDALPIYCGVRPYQSILGAVLTEAAFQPGMALARFVKHTAIHVREPATSKTRLLIETSFPGVISTNVDASSKPANSLQRE